MHFAASIICSVSAIPCDCGGKSRSQSHYARQLKSKLTDDVLLLMKARSSCKVRYDVNIDECSNTSTPGGCRSGERHQIMCFGGTRTYSLVGGQPQGRSLRQQPPTPSGGGKGPGLRELKGVLHPCNPRAEKYMPCIFPHQNAAHLRDCPLWY